MLTRKAIRQEFSADQEMHRLVNTVTGTATQWAGYRAFTYLGGWVGHTAFWGAKEGVVSADEFCLMAGVGA
jgi:hypothetical protein